MSTGQEPIDVYQAIEYLQQQDPPTTVEEVDERLNIIERILASLSPQDDYNRALLQLLNELKDSFNVVVEVDEEGETSGFGAISSLLRDINDNMARLALADTTDLPAGLQGEAVVSINQGQEGIATFEFSGGRFAARVEADEDIKQFNDVRVMPSGTNIVTPIPDEETAGTTKPSNIIQIYNKDVNSAGVDILANDINPSSEASSFRVSITLDTDTKFSVRVKPQDDSIDAFTEDLNDASSIGANNKHEFVFDADPGADYNFRCPDSSVTVKNLRVQELLESQ